VDISAGADIGATAEAAALDEATGDVAAVLVGWGTEGRARDCGPAPREEAAARGPAFEVARGGIGDEGRVHDLRARLRDIRGPRLESDGKAATDAVAILRTVLVGSCGHAARERCRQL